jgi:acetoin utilization deacetylase AcuC-like enzyme
MKETGVFYSEIMRNEHAPSDMNIGKGFDGIVREGLFETEAVKLFEAKLVAEELVLQVHSKEWVEQVRREGMWEVSACSAGAVVGAFDKILSAMSITRRLPWPGRGRTAEGRGSP